MKTIIVVNLEPETFPRHKEDKNYRMNYLCNVLDFIGGELLQEYEGAELTLKMDGGNRQCIIIQKDEEGWDEVEDAHELVERLVNQAITQVLH